jgi:hypothetical protein
MHIEINVDDDDEFTVHTVVFTIKMENSSLQKMLTYRNRNLHDDAGSYENDIHMMMMMMMMMMMIAMMMKI